MMQIFEERDQLIADWMVRFSGSALLVTVVVPEPGSWPWQQGKGMAGRQQWHKLPISNHYCSGASSCVVCNDGYNVFCYKRVARTVHDPDLLSSEGLVQTQSDTMLSNDERKSPQTWHSIFMPMTI